MKRLILSILLVMSVSFTYAQSGTGVSGQVLDSKTQKPLQSVIATFQNIDLTELTNAEGKFTFTNVPAGSQLLLFKIQGYKDQLVNVDVETGKILDLGVIVMEEDITDEQQLSLVTLTDNDLGDDNSGSENTSGLLQATRDNYQQAAAFNWGQARFRIRGLDNEYGTTMINGIVMNKIYDGRPQWSNWGGLNDATRNQEFTMGSAPSDYTFGGILGTQEINTRASIYRKGSRISFSGTNTNYTGRVMGTHVSGMNTNGWAFVVSASRRWAEEGYFEGTDYDANSLFVSVEKKINDKHSLNFTSIFAQNSRGKSSPNTKEVNDLMGIEYNSYWGWQDGRKRNSRDKDIEEPINMLSHYWKISDKTRLNTNVAYQVGYVGNSRLDFQLGNNPDPTYYRNLPSYYLNFPDNYVTDINGVVTNPSADAARTYFLNNSQIDWTAMYLANQNSSMPGRSVYALYEDRNDDKQFSANSVLFSSLADNISLNAGASFKKLKSHNYQKMLDLLGGAYFSDIDIFYTGDASQSDLNNPNRQIVEGDEYGYNYNLMANVIDAFTQFKFRYKKTDFYLAQTFSRSEYQREGLYRNGIYANNSFGKGAKVTFENFGFKGGLTYKITGQHLLDFNAAYLSKAPGMRNVFSNARLNNNITPDIDSERISSMDASYIIRMPKLKLRLTGFMSKIQNATELSFFYGEGLFDEDAVGDGNEDSFISEIVTGMDKKQIGGELGVEYQITSTIKLIGAASYGQYTYDNNPNVKLNDDAQASPTNTNPLTDFGPAYMKDYRLPGMPQQAYSFGVEYRDPHFWWIGANVNYLADSYLDVSNILRTSNFVVESDGIGYAGATPDVVRNILRQEKFDPYTLLNVTGGKSWKIKNTTFGFFASINNVLDTTYKTGGFEQSRKANFPEYQADNAYGTPSFGSKYFYGYGRTYFVNLYVNF
ncbi:carboxypeptidase-like regulatory domain-containing protein [Flavobacterium sp.]|uniref:carboxypeptidase-like regulatory domain-containing protein n=1 Tax=Flavobacterium sp. TaxID=239 RepID=UPI002B4B667A|nr:carboxypeptidase-like regulatory domain-containing protein [Flavobacterium sp.]HLP63225.1 carboxypeptidase-like regulatory domain-containing protein [Flavobacterium sp.]